MNIKGMKVLSIDDNINDLSIIERYARSLSLDVESYEDPQEGLRSSQGTDYDVILVNYEMSKFNGLELIKAVRQHNSIIPIIMLTTLEDDVKVQEEALKLGANDFLNKPINFASFQARIQSTLTLSKALALSKGTTSLLDDEVQKATKTLQDNEYEALKVLGTCAEYKDYKAGSHTLRVSHYCKALAKAANLKEKVQDVVFYASQFHDLGKIGIADEILLKQGPLNEDELEIMKTHSRIGYDILKWSKSGYLKAGAVIAYSHHEKYDGTGYPIGLSGETIPILGRIVAIADVFDALTHERPYKKAWNIEDACTFLMEEKGKHFDPSLVDLFIEHLDEMKVIKSQFTDEIQVTSKRA